MGLSVAMAGRWRGDGGAMAGAIEGYLSTFVRGWTTSPETSLG
jgi:hypothetical protein